MKTIEIEVPQEVVNQIERCQYEVNSRQGVIDRYLEKHMNDTDGSAIESAPFQYFMSQLAAAEAELEITKNQMSEVYIPQALKEHQTEWIIDFSTGIMTVTILCDCEIEGF